MLKYARFRAGLTLLSILVSLNAQATDRDFNLPAMRSLIQAGGIRSIDQLVSALPRSYSRFYTFMYESRSLQRTFTTSNTPRAIVYGPDAKFIMTFTEGSKGSDADNIELMSWSDETSRFTLNELTFDRAGGLHVSEDNPAQCVRCHGESVRPIFDPYRIWPGAYGSISKQGRDRIGVRTPEAGLYNEFVRRFRHAGRYAALPSEIVSGTAALDNAGNITVANGANTEPNADLTQKLIQLNNRRVARWLLDSPAYVDFRYALKALNDGCYRDTDIEAYFTPESRRHGASYQATLDDTLQRITGQFEIRLAQTVARNHVEGIALPNFALQSAQGLRKTARFRYILDRMGLDATQTRIAHENGDFDLSNGLARSKDVPYIDMTDIAVRTTERADERFADLDCDELRRASLDRLSRLRPDGRSVPGVTTVAPESGMGQASVTSLSVAPSLSLALLRESCMDCHSGASRQIRRLPFQSEDELRRSLRESPTFLETLRDRLTGNGVVQMPLGDPLPASQVRQLLQYLGTLAH